MGKLYTKGTTVVDEIWATPRYDILENGGSAFKSTMQINKSTSPSVAGTLLDAARMNNIENGIDALDTLLAFISPGFIGENGGQLLYVGAAAYSVLPGSVLVNGALLSWSSNIARTGLSLTANTLYYVYLYSNSGTPAVEESTTAPAWDTTLAYWKKTGDATRRCIGFIEASAANTMRKFLNTVNGRNSEFLYTDGDTTGRVPVAAGNATGAWTSFTLSPLVPVHATHMYSVIKQVNASSGDDGIVGISPVDLGASVGNQGTNTVRARGSAANASVFFGANWNAISVSQTYYYRLQIVSGTPTVNIEINGARIVR